MRTVIGPGADAVRMEMRFLFTGDELKRPTHIIIAFESFSAEPRFASLSGFAWMADGSDIVMRDLDRRLGSSSQGVIERVSAILSVGEFETLVAADRISGRLGSLGFVLRAEDRAALRHFASKIPIVAQPFPATAR